MGMRAIVDTKRVPVIDLAGLSYRYPGAAEDALRELDLRVEEGEFVAVVGANGSGKSTLARLLGGLERPSGARRAVSCGHDLLNEAARLDARRDIGVLFQNPENQIVAECVEADIAFGLENLSWSVPDMRRRVEEMLIAFDLVDLRRREPHMLSGGQKQRTALAGVLAIPRRVLVLDEPTAMLDPAGRDEVLAVVRGLRASGMAIVLITQEMDEVGDADRVVALAAGRVVYSGGASALFSQPQLVADLRLDLPAAAALTLALRESGRHLPRLAMTVDELLEMLTPGS